MGSAIESFTDKFYFLSNFYSAKTALPSTLLCFHIFRDEVIFPTSEHAFQAAKATWSGDFTKIENSPTPSLAKNYGNLISLRRDWEEVKFDIMYAVVKDKFTRNKPLQKKLLATKTRKLIEGNNHCDMVWGVYKGRGENHLGKILMRIRKEFR